MPTPAKKKQKKENHEPEEEAPLPSLVLTYLSYLILFVFGHVRDFFGKIIWPKSYAHLLSRHGYAPLVSDFESFYTRRIYVRICDCFNRIICSVPGAHVSVLERRSYDAGRTFVYSGRAINCINLGSYNYLGFAQSEGPCADYVANAISRYGLSTPAPRCTAPGLHALHIEMERVVARFLGTEDAICISMGFATNSTTLPALVSRGSLVISDELNHASIVFGARLTGAAVRVFKHDSPAALEEVLRDAITQGQPRTRRPWRNILVVVEGLYSMEGTICNLPEFVRLKAKYKFNLYMDEAHSIGAVGPRGRGVCDYYGIDPSNVDILMGTFTKSFGAAGGYIAGSKSLIDYLRVKCHSSIYAESMPIPVCAQIIAATKVMMGELAPGLGQQKLRTLATNIRYFRSRLHRLGLIVYGQHDSPVVPVLIFQPGKLAAFSRECLARGVAVVVVGAPATPLVYSRARICLSASHTKADLDRALAVIDEVSDLLWMKLSRRDRGRFELFDYEDSEPHHHNQTCAGVEKIENSILPEVIVDTAIDKKQVRGSALQSKAQSRVSRTPSPAAKGSLRRQKDSAINGQF